MTMQHALTNITQILYVTTTLFLSLVSDVSVTSSFIKVISLIV